MYKQLLSLDQSSYLHETDVLIDEDSQQMNWINKIISDRAKLYKKQSR